MIRNFKYLTVFTSAPGVLPEQNDRYRIQPWKVNEIKAYKNWRPVWLESSRLKSEFFQDQPKTKVSQSWVSEHSKLIQWFMHKHIPKKRSMRWNQRNQLFWAPSGKIGLGTGQSNPSKLRKRGNENSCKINERWVKCEILKIALSHAFQSLSHSQIQFRFI